MVDEDNNNTNDDNVSIEPVVEVTVNTPEPEPVVETTPDVVVVNTDTTPETPDVLFDHERRITQLENDLALVADIAVTAGEAADDAQQTAINAQDIAVEVISEPEPEPEPVDPAPTKTLDEEPKQGKFLDWFFGGKK